MNFSLIIGCIAAKMYAVLTTETLRVNTYVMGAPEQVLKLPTFKFSPNCPRNVTTSLENNTPGFAIYELPSFVTYD